MAIRNLKPYLKNIADTLRSKLSINPNLFDINTYPLTINKYITPTSGTLLEANATSMLACTEDYMPCSQWQGKTLTLNRCGGWTVGIGFYDDDKTFVSGVQYSLSNGAGTPISFVIPDNATYFRFTVDNNYMDEIKLEEGKYSTEYVPFDYNYGKIDAQDFSNKISEVYEKGVQSEYDRFWDDFQNYGKRTFYSSAFAGQGWTAETLKPKYPIVTNAATNRSNSMFTYSNITEIMIPLYFYDTTSSSTFSSCTKCIRIGDDSGGGIWVTKDRIFTSNFSSCSKLEEIRFIDYNEKGEYIPSEIGSSISFSNSSLLSVSSMINIITHLVDYSVDSPGTNTLTFHADSWANLEASDRTPQSEGIEFSGTWREYVSSIGWNT